MLHPQSLLPTWRFPISMTDGWNMLSKIELEFLKSPERFNSEYQRILRHRIRVKIQRLKSEANLLANQGFLQAYDGEKSLNQDALRNCDLHSGGRGFKSPRSTWYIINAESVHLLSSSVTILPYIWEGVDTSHGPDSKPQFWSDAQLHAQGVSRRLNCLDNSFLSRRDKTTTLKLLVYGLYI